MSELKPCPSSRYLAAKEGALMKKIKGLKRWLKLPTQNYVLIWKLAKRITKLEQETRFAHQFPKGYLEKHDGLWFKTEDAEHCIVFRDKKNDSLLHFNPVYRCDLQAVAIFIERVKNEKA